MSAEELGKRLRAEVREQRLDELLTTLRLLNDPTSNTRLGIPHLDDLLGQITPTLDPTTLSLTPAPPIIELTSPGPGSGKTSLLYYITALSILPASHHDTNLGGQNAAICILDTESAFSVPRLATITLHILLSALPTLNREEAKSLIHASLSHVHTFRPNTLATLITTVTSLPQYFLARTNVSTHRRLAAILLDSASTFTYPSRHESTISNKPSRYAALATALKSSTAALCTPCIYTTWNLGAGASLRNQLPGPWLTLPSARLLIRRTEVQGFGSGAVQAVREMKRRDDVVREAGFEVFALGAEGRLDGGFVLRVTGTGVGVVGE